MKRILFALLAGVAMLPPASFAATTGQTSCINTHRSSSWRAVDDHTLYISESKTKVYAVEFAASCPRMSSPFAKFVQINRSGSSYICSPIDLDIRVFETPGFSNFCLATGIRELSPQEIQALPAKVKP